MEQGTRDFDKDYTKRPTERVRARFGCDTDHGEVTRFLVQLEYRMPDSWTFIVRSDHNPTAFDGHDVETEGVHMDLNRGGEKVTVRQIGPPMPASAGLNRAEEHLIGHAEKHTKRFERWHNIQNHNDR